MFGGNRYRRRLASALGVAGTELSDLAAARADDERMGTFLGCIVSMQADTLFDFLVAFRRDESLHQLANAAVEPERAQRVLRVATWAAVLGIPGSALGHRYPDAPQAALDVFGVEGEWELRIVDYQPESDVREMLGKRFERQLLASMIAVGTGDEAPAVSDAAAGAWNAYAVGAFVGLRTLMDSVHPQPGFSRLSEVEAQIKAEQSARESQADDPAEPESND